jgi:hypothetical protein
LGFDMAASDYNPSDDEKIWLKRQYEVGMNKTPPVRKRKLPPEPKGFRDWIRATYPGGQLVALPSGLQVRLAPGNADLEWREYVQMFPDVVQRYKRSAMYKRLNQL